MGALGALQVGLAREHVGGAARDAGCVDLGRARAGKPGCRGLHLVLATAVAHHRAGELLLGGVFTTLAQGAHTFEAKAERGSVHGPVLDRPSPGLSAGGRLSDGWWSSGAELEARDRRRGWSRASDRHLPSGDRRRQRRRPSSTSPATGIRRASSAASRQQLGVGLVDDARLVHPLPQERVDRRAQPDRGVDQRVGAALVGADRDQVLLLPVGGERRAQPLSAASRTSGVTISPTSRETLCSTSIAG